jgi:hypothetical protein
LPRNATDISLLEEECPKIRLIVDIQSTSRQRSAKAGPLHVKQDEVEVKVE